MPADYTSLRLTQLPSSGGDTLWASGYELYDRFSPAYRRFLEGLTATFVGDGFLKAAAANPEQVVVHEGPRGAPANVGRELSAVHPVVRTNPVTGWKSLFAVGPFPKWINELEGQESEELLGLFRRRILDAHDLTVRFKWRNENDIGEFAWHSFWFGKRNLRADFVGFVQRSGTTAVPSTARRSTMTVWASGSATVLLGSARCRILIRTASRGRRNWLWRQQSSSKPLRKESSTRARRSPLD